MGTTVAAGGSTQILAGLSSSALPREENTPPSFTSVGLTSPVVSEWNDPIESIAVEIEVATRQLPIIFLSLILILFDNIQHWQ